MFIETFKKSVSKPSKLLIVTGFVEFKGMGGVVSLFTLFLCDLDLFIKMGIIFVI